MLQTCLPLRIVRIFYGFGLKTTHYGLIKKILRKSVIYDESDFDYFGLFSVIFKKCLIMNVVCTWLKVWCSRVIIKLGWKTGLIYVRIFFYIQRSMFCRHYCLVNFPFDPDINIYFRFTIYFTSHIKCFKHQFKYCCFIKFPKKLYPVNIDSNTHWSKMFEPCHLLLQHMLTPQVRHQWKPCQQ